jgi:hypothetical protein
MEVGDLVTLSATGKKQHQNSLARCATFGIIVKVLDRGKYRPCSNPTSTENCIKPMLIVDWWYSPKNWRGDKTRQQNHWRYEIKKLKAQSKQ